LVSVEEARRRNENAEEGWKHEHTPHEVPGITLARRAVEFIAEHSDNRSSDSVRNLPRKETSRRNIRRQLNDIEEVVVQVNKPH